MTAVSREQDAPLERAEYEVTALRDPEAIRAMLEPNRAYSAYAIAQLDPVHFPRNIWYQSSGPTGSALLLHSRSPLGNAFFSMGEPAALDAALSLHPGPRFAFGTLTISHKPVLRRFFLLTRPQLMLRMSITPDTFSPSNTPVQRLHGTDLPAVNRFYSMEGGPTAYRADHLEEAVYYGVYDGPNLIAIAGTHVVSKAERIAVVGNVFTHPRYRGQGLASATTSAVTAELLDYCDLVVLTVEQDNAPAVNVYQKLGYQSQCQLHETPLVRKEPFGVVSFVRRTLARWRGRQEQREVILR